MSQNTFRVNSLDDEIPKSVTSLEFGSFFNQPLVQGVIPNSVTSLTFGSHFNKTLVPGVIPNSVTGLEFGSDFNQPLVPGVIPSSVTSLTFGDKFNQPLVPGVIPNSVTGLEFGSDFDKPLVQGVIPNSVTSLKFGDNFNQPLIIPNSVTSLTFGYFFNQSLVPGIIPNSVTSLTFGYFFNQLLDQGVIPNSVTSLTFGYYFNQPLVPGSIPNSVTSLKFGDKFNQPLVPGVIPNSVTSLTFGNKINQPLVPGVIPNSVTSLTFGKKINQPLVPGVIPNSVTSLKFGIKFNQPLGQGVIPDSVETLYIGNETIHIRLTRIWDGFKQFSNDPEINMDLKINRLRELYLTGVPIPVEQHEDSILEAEGFDPSLIRHFSINREEHIVCHKGFSKKLQTLIRQWIYGDYSKFNTFISSLNKDASPVQYSNVEFLGEYKTGAEAYHDMRKAILTAPVLDHPIFAWRGMHGLSELCINARVGSFVAFSRFMACSVSQEVSCEFAEDGILMLIELPAQTPMLNLTCVKRSEPEFILPDRTVFQVMGRKPISTVCAGVSCKELVHLKLIGLYTKDKQDFELYLDSSNPEEVQIDHEY